jgi:16S rRNA (cytosine967-C5)-methyltransferase
VLVRVTEDGAFASAALDAELGRAGLDSRDAALATELVYGTLRVLPALDRSIATHLHRPEQKLDARLQAALRLGAYQIAHMSRVPLHAAVDESVRLLTSARGPRLAAVANAVLRKLASAYENAPRQTAERMALPGWMATELVAALGEARAEALLASLSESPPLCLRVRQGTDREALAAELRGARPEASIVVGELSPQAILLRRAGDPRRLPGFAEGRFTVQEEGAQLVALALGAQPGERVADLCAGHGGKTALLAEAVGATGRVLAVDLDERKLDKLEHERARLGLDGARVERKSLDLSVGVGGLGADFDRVLVDAPCTGLGTLRRRPELLLRVGAHDPQRMAELQLAIARNAARLVRPGGLLVIAVCSFTRAEGPELLARLEVAEPSLCRSFEPPAGFESLSADADGVCRLGPWLGHTERGSPDAYQLLALRRA